jgi:hypothetical protein
MAVGIQIEARRAAKYGLSLAPLGLDLVAGRAVMVPVTALGLLVILDVGLALRLLLAIRLVVRLVFNIGLALGLFLLVDLLVLLDVRLILGLVVVLGFEVLALDQAAVREPIADPVRHLADPVRHLADPVGDMGHLVERRQRVEPAQFRRRDPGRGNERGSRSDRLDSAVAALVRLVVVGLERRLDCGGEDSTHINRHLYLPPLGTDQEREPLFFRVEPVVRLRAPPDEPRPFAELLLRLDEERLRAPEADAFEPPEDLERPPEDELALRLRPEADDVDLPDDELRLRALDDVRPLDDERSLTCRMPRPAFSMREPGSRSRLPILSLAPLASLPAPFVASGANATSPAPATNPLAAESEPFFEFLRAFVATVWAASRAARPSAVPIASPRSLAIAFLPDSLRSDYPRISSRNPPLVRLQLRMGRRQRTLAPRREGGDRRGSRRQRAQARRSRDDRLRARGKVGSPLRHGFERLGLGRWASRSAELMENALAV